MNNNNRPSNLLLPALGLLALLSLGVGCAHEVTTFGPARSSNFAVGPGGKGVATASDFDANRSAPNFVERGTRDRVSVDRVSMPPTNFRR